MMRLALLVAVAVAVAGAACAPPEPAPIPPPVLVSPRFVTPPVVEPALVNVTGEFAVRFSLSGPPLLGVSVVFADIPLPCVADGNDWTCAGNAALGNAAFTDLDGELVIAIDVDEGARSAFALLTVDRSSPVIGIIGIDYGGPSAANGSRPVVVSVAYLSDDVDPSTLHIREDLSARTPTPCDGAEGRCTYSLDLSLADDAHFFTVTAKDFAGYETSASSVFAVDRTAPPPPNELAQFRLVRRPWGDPVEPPGAHVSVLPFSVPGVDVELVFSAEGAGELARIAFDAASVPVEVPVPIDATRIVVHTVNGSGSESEPQLIDRGLLVIGTGEVAGAPPNPVLIDSISDLDLTTLVAVSDAIDGAFLAEEFDGQTATITGARPVIALSVALSGTGIAPADVISVGVSARAGGTGAAGIAGTKLLAWDGTGWLSGGLVTPGTPDNPQATSGIIPDPLAVVGGEQRFFFAFGSVGTADGSVVVVDAAWVDIGHTIAP